LSPASRGILWRISALFALDGIGGGFLTAALGEKRLELVHELVPAATYHRLATADRSRAGRMVHHYV